VVADVDGAVGDDPRAVDQRVLADGDPIATELFARYKDVRMPNLSLAPDEVAVLLSYIEKQGRGR